MANAKREGTKLVNKRVMRGKAFTFLAIIKMTLCINAISQDFLPPPPPLAFLLTEENVNEEFQSICELNGKTNFSNKYRTIVFFKIIKKDTTFVLQRHLTNDTVSKVSEVVKKGKNTDTLYSISQNNKTLTSIKFYNKEGQEIEQLIFDKSGHTIFKIQTKYDSLKRVSDEYKIQLLSDREFICESIKINHNQNGTKIIKKTDHFNELYGGPVTVTTKFINKSGQTTKIELSKKEKVFAITELKWNSTNLIESIAYKNEQFNGIVFTKYTYNELGFPTQISQEVDRLDNQIFYIQYNE